MLRSTLEHLARHRSAARRYLVILAMEMKESGHEEKARQLQNEFQNRCTLLTFLQVASCTTIADVSAFPVLHLKQVLRQMD